MSTSFKTAIASLALLLCLHTSVALPKEADNPEGSAILLNNHPVAAEQLASVRRGVISLMALNPSTADGTKMRFFVYIKRAGKIVNPEAYAHNHAVLDYEIAEVLRDALSGDQLVIEPADPARKSAKKTVLLRNLLPPFQWFLLPNMQKNNC